MYQRKYKGDLLGLEKCQSYVFDLSHLAVLVNYINVESERLYQGFRKRVGIISLQRGFILV